MRPIPKLTVATSFVIERVTRKADAYSSPEFTVGIRLADGELRSVSVSYTTLLDFAKVRDAALFTTNVLLRHEAEQGTPDALRVWLGVISEAIIRGNERPAATKGGD